MPRYRAPLRSRPCPTYHPSPTDGCTAPTVLVCGERTLVLDRARVMGILNVTPDSFSDGGAARLGGRRVRSRPPAGRGGVPDIVDVGGESTRPGAAPVPVDEELERVIPVIERVRAELDTIVSIDSQPSRGHASRRRRRGPG